MPRAIVKSKSRGWWREYFHDHPGLIIKDPEAFVGTASSAKAKVYCIKCFDKDIAFLQLKDQESLVLGRIQVARDIKHIETHCATLNLYS